MQMLKAFLFFIDGVKDVQLIYFRSLIIYIIEGRTGSRGACSLYSFALAT